MRCKVFTALSSVKKLTITTAVCITKIRLIYMPVIQRTKCCKKHSALQGKRKQVCLFVLYGKGNI